MPPLSANSGMCQGLAWIRLIPGSLQPEKLFHLSSALGKRPGSLSEHRKAFRLSQFRWSAQSRGKRGEELLGSLEKATVGITLGFLGIMDMRVKSKCADILEVYDALNGARKMC